MHRYAALSYRWGKDVSFTTTKATLDSRKTSMALSDMPKLFQDAIQVLRCLNIKYLWIDALCIIQDSKEDWERESSRMLQVYEDCGIK
jgi:Heterokaryon incompatibility protein (HET)